MAGTVLWSKRFARGSSLTVVPRPEQRGPAVVVSGIRVGPVSQRCLHRIDLRTHPRR